MSLAQSHSPAQLEDFDVGPAPIDPPGLPFADWLDGEAGWYRSFDSTAGDFVALLLAEAARLARQHDCPTPSALMARIGWEVEG